LSAYLGDDVTDEDAFKALANKGLRALVREQLRETVADIWLIPPVELREFLKRWIKACEK
jgi:trehalose 6-phosphate phosphatase